MYFCVAAYFFGFVLQHKVAEFQRLYKKNYAAIFILISKLFYYLRKLNK